MAQPGRALRSGRRGRWFKSSRPDFDKLLLAKDFRSCYCTFKTKGIGPKGRDLDPFSLQNSALQSTRALLRCNPGVGGDSTRPQLGGKLHARGPWQMRITREYPNDRIPVSTLHCVRDYLARYGHNRVCLLHQRGANAAMGQFIAALWNWN